MIDGFYQLRLRRITADSRMIYDVSFLLISEFQKMRTIMSRMKKRMVGKPAIGEEEQPISVGHKVLHRAAKKKKKGHRVDARYFG